MAYFSTGRHICSRKISVQLNHFKKSVHNCVNLCPISPSPCLRLPVSILFAFVLFVSFVVKLPGSGTILLNKNKDIAKFIKICEKANIKPQLKRYHAERETFQPSLF